MARLWIVDEKAVETVAKAWADAGRAPRIHRLAQRELRRDWPVLARALDRLTGEDPR